MTECIIKEGSREKALKELKSWLTEEKIKWKDADTPLPEVEILEPWNKELKEKIKGQVRKLRDKHDTCAYIEGVTDFTFGF